jgi:FKBP-type peptidyl-prolyl cis-trans isomerase
LDGESIGGDTIGLTFNLGNSIIEAWHIMLPEMKEGGKIEFFSPSGYCFGVRGTENIPSNSILRYEIELIGVIDSEIEQKQIDLLIIDDFLNESKVDFKVDTFGIRYVVVSEGLGQSPNSTDTVLVKYEGSFLSGVVFDSSTEGFEFPLNNLIDAWKFTLPQMKEGEKRKIYAPSSYCYGTSGAGIIPPNTVLSFEIELLDINP